MVNETSVRFRRVLLIASAVSLLLAAPLQADSDDRLSSTVDAFVRALAADDLAAFEAIADAPVTTPEWMAIRDLFETSRCIEIRSYRATVEQPDEHGATIALDVDASRQTRGPHNVRLAVPALWVLELVCGTEGCRVHAVTRRELAVARAIAVSSPEAWEGLMRVPGIDEGDVARSLIDEAYFPSSTVTAHGCCSIAQRRALSDFARELVHRNGDLAAESYLLRMLATSRRISGEDGVPLGVEGLELARASGDADALAEATFSLGLARWGHGDTSGALDDLRASASALEELRDPRTALKSIAMTSYIAMEDGQLRVSLSSARRLLEESGRCGWSQGEASAEIYLGLVHSILNAPEVARTYLESAYRKSIEARDSRGEIYALNNLASCDLDAGEFDRAAAGFRRALSHVGGDTLEGVRSEIENGLAVSLLRAGRLAEAEEVTQGILAHARSVGLKQICIPLAILGELRLEQGHPRQAVEELTDALSRCGETSHVNSDGNDDNHVNSIWSMNATLGRALHRLGRTAEAERALRRSIASIEAQRSLMSVSEDVAVRFFEGKLDPYADLAQILAVRGAARETLNIVEHVRARALAAILERGKIDLSKTMTAAEKDRERDLNARLAVLNQTVLAKPKDAEARSQRDALRLELDRFRVELYVSRPSLLVRRPLSGTVPAIPPDLADTVVIEYLASDRGIVVVTARRAAGGQTITTSKFVSITPARLAALAEKFARSIERRDAGYRDRARELYDLLLLPVEAQLRSRTRVCIVPDGALWRVPFQALVDGDGRHLLERMTVFYAASLRTLVLADEHSSEERRASGDHRRAVLAFGDPRISRKTAAEAAAFRRGTSVGPLPDAQREVEAIRRLYPRDATRVLVGEEATEKTFKREAARYRVLHVAAHGLFDERAPMYSSLLLSRSGDGSEDGFLEAREIADLSLHSDVAILSACDTARGRYGAGEGLIGMSWALSVAGCPTAIVSQWKAASAPTADLMIAFHRNLLAGHSKSDALRRAALALMKERAHEHPFYWAAFVLVGAP